MGGFGLGRAIVLAAILGAGAAGAATVQVKAGDTTPDAGGCGSKANPCDTIQAGVDAAATGDVVNVAKGDYAENVVVTTPGIRLRGAGALLGAPLASCPGDAARVNIAVCEGLGVQLSCDAAWQPAGDLIPRAASCFWTGSACAPCDAASADDLGCTNSCTAAIPAALTIAADDVTVEKLRVRAPPLVGIGVEDGADGALLRGVRVEGAGQTCIAGDGDRLAVSGSIARSCENGGIVVDGADAALDKNRVAGTNGPALRVRGVRARLTRNTLTGVAGLCARVDGDAATLERNRLSACGGRGIDARGSGLRVSKNQVRGADSGIDVSCRAIPTVCADVARATIAPCADQASEPACAATAQQSANNGLLSCFWDGNCNACNLSQEQDGNCTDTCLATPGDRCADALVDGNKIAETSSGECIRAESFDAGLRLERNQLSLCGQGGVFIEGTAVHAERNTVADCGAFADGVGFRLEGGGHTLVSNVARGCSGDGFRVDTGENVALVGNQAIENYDDGFDLQGGLTTVIDDAVATNNVAGGIEIGEFATTTTVSGSRASGNLIDFCDEGTGTTSTGNQFGISGTPCTPD